MTQDAPQLAGGAASDGDRLPGSPEHQASLLVNYMHSFSGGLDINVSYGMTTQSDVFTKLGNGSNCCRIDGGLNSGVGETLSGFTLHNASVTVSGSQWDLMLYVNNLTDKYAETGVRNDGSFRVSSIETPLMDDGATPTGQDPFTFRRFGNYMVTPRTIGLDFRYRTDF